MKTILTTALLLSAFAAATPTQAAPNTTAFLNQYCQNCHGPQLQMADRRFDQLTADLSNPLYQDILNQLNLGKMPPQGAPQPTSEQRQQIIDHLTPQLLAHQRQQKSKGAKTVLRRLNRYEYNRTVRDLLRLPDLLADPTDVFPPDAVEDNFDNIGSALITSDFLLSGYLAAAQAFIDHAVAPAARPEISKYQFQAPFHPTFNRHDGQDRPGQYQNIRKNTSDEGGFFWLDKFQQGVPQDGYYNLRIRAQGVNRVYPYDERIVGVSKTDPLRMGVVASSAEYGNLALRTTSDRPLIEFDLPDDAPQWFETRIWLDRGYQPRLTFPNGPNGVKPLRRPLNVRYPETFPEFLRKYVVDEGPITAETVDASYNRRVSKEGASTTELTTQGTSRDFNRRDGWATFFSEYQGPRVRVHEVEIEGPYFDSWPPPSHVALFGANEPTLENAEPILRRFATKAFRRPVTESELKPLVALVHQRAKKGDPPLEALKAGLRAVLAAPGFLYIAASAGPDKTQTLDPYALASRLSYFLWSSMPDETLLETARTNQLQNPETLKTQTLRMLNDPRASALSEQFASRWLELYKIGSMPPSPRDFSQYYVDGLEQAMKTETRLFFQNALENNLSIDRFLDADFTFVNSGLARLYGVEGVHSAKFEKKKLPDRRRGGLLGMASVLTASANGIDTSPVVRGVWVLENLLGQPPTPPPPDVEPLEPDIRGATTIRDQLQRHRKVATCNACHQKIDPLGFALENFDPIGGWRDRYPRPGGEDPKIDPSAELPAGDKFTDIISFKDILLEKHRNDFARCLTEKMLAYALGRTLEPIDEPEVDRLTADLRERGSGLRDLVVSVAGSELFVRK